MITFSAGAAFADPSSPVVTIQIHGNESLRAFQQLISRGANTWDQAPAEIKQLHDAVVHGKILQDYTVQGLQK